MALLPLALGVAAMLLAGGADGYERDARLADEAARALEVGPFSFREAGLADAVGEVFDAAGAALSAAGLPGISAYVRGGGRPEAATFEIPRTNALAAFEIAAERFGCEARLDGGRVFVARRKAGARERREESRGGGK